MTTLVSFLFVLGVLIFVHELGHFLAARRLGVRVLTFSLGFGPKILKTTRGDTEYCISAIPLGGYVKIPGMHRPAAGDLDVHFGRAVEEALAAADGSPARSLAELVEADAAARRLAERGVPVG